MQAHLLTSDIKTIKAARFSLAAVMFCFAVLLLLIVCLQPSEQKLLLVGVLAAITAEVLLLDFHVVNPLVVATAVYSMIYILPVSLGDYQSASSTATLVSMGLAALHLGACIAYLVVMAVRGNLRKNVPPVPFTIKILPISLIGWTLTGLVVVSWIANPSLLTEGKGANQFNMSTMDQLGALAAMLLAPLSVLVFLHFCNQNEVRQRYFLNYLRSANLPLTFFMLSPVFFDLMTAGRSHTVSAMLSWLVGYSVYVRRIPILKALGVSFGLVFFSALMLLMRETSIGGVEGLLLAFNALNVIAVDDLLVAATQIGHQLRIFEEIVSYTTVNGYQYGMSYLKTLVNIVPLFHFMYDDTFPVGVLYREFLAPDNVTGYDFSGIAEMYLQGGVIGIFLSQFVLGFVLACVYYNMYLKKRVTVVLLYAGLLFGTIWWYRSDLLNMMRYTENFFIIYIGYRILCGLSARRIPQAR